MPQAGQAVLDGRFTPVHHLHHTHYLLLHETGFCTNHTTHPHTTRETSEYLPYLTHHYRTPTVPRPYSSAPFRCTLSAGRNVINRSIPYPISLNRYRTSSFQPRTTQSPVSRLYHQADYPTEPNFRQFWLSISCYLSPFCTLSRFIS